MSFISEETRSGAVKVIPVIQPVHDKFGMIELMRLDQLDEDGYKYFSYLETTMEIEPGNYMIRGSYVNNKDAFLYSMATVNFKENNVYEIMLSPVNVTGGYCKLHLKKLQ